MKTMKTLAIAATAAAALLALATPQDAEACSPPAPELDLRFEAADGVTVPRSPRLLFAASSVTPTTPDKFTLTNTTTGAQTDVETALALSGFFTTYYTLSVTAPLDEGAYLLEYATEDFSVAPPPGGPQPMYERSLEFQVFSVATHPGQLEIGMEWSRLNPGPNDPIFQDSCGGSNAQTDRIELTFPAACRTQDAGIRYTIEYLDDQGQVLYSSLRAVSSNDIDDQADAEGLIRSTFTSQTQGSTGASCVRVTPSTTTGVVGAPVELCVPTRCAIGQQFPDDPAGFQACDNPNGLLTSVDLPDPYVAASCQLSSGFDPCDEVVCAATHECVDGACVEIDLCAGVTCADGETCEAGVCEPDVVDPCAGVTCADGETCSEGVCEAPEPDPCDGVTCAAGEICFEGSCYGKVTPDPCDDVTCEDAQICFEGTCYDIDDGTGGTNNGGTNNGGTNNGGTNGGGGGNANAADDGGCSSTPSGAPTSPLLALLALGLVGLWRRAR